MPAERPAPPAHDEAANSLQVRHDTRATFVAAFPTQITRIGELVDRAAARDKADAGRAFKLAADDALCKPFSPQELRARIGRLLR